MMIYRINLFPERAERAASKLTRLRYVCLLTATAGTGVLLVAAITLSGVLLREQARVLRAQNERMRAQVYDTGASGSPAKAAYVLRARSARTVWSPKIAAMAEDLGKGLRIHQIEASRVDRGRGVRLEVDGVVLQGGGMEDVSSFLGALRSDRRISDDLPVVKLGTLGGTAANTFHITCEPARKDS